MMKKGEFGLIVCIICFVTVVAIWGHDIFLRVGYLLSSRAECDQIWEVQHGDMARMLGGFDLATVVIVREEVSDSIIFIPIRHAQAKWIENRNMARRAGSKMEKYEFYSMFDNTGRIFVW